MSTQAKKQREQLEQAMKEAGLLVRIPNWKVEQFNKSNSRPPKKGK